MSAVRPALLRTAFPIVLVAAAVSAAPAAPGAEADAEWAFIEKLDQGPSEKPRTRPEAIRIAKDHLARQRAAIVEFLARHPDDSRVLDARVRLASITATVAKMDGDQRSADDALRQLIAIENDKGVSAARRADIAFRRISLQLQNIQGRPDEIRDRAVSAARGYAERFPADKRSARLLVEAATLCDQLPDLKRRLLDQALASTSEPAVQARIRDDLKRLDALGTSPAIRFDTIDGGRFDLAAQRGNVVALVFWAAESPHSLLWLDQFRREIAKIPRAHLRIATVSLDHNRAELAARLREFDIAGWPTHFDGKGWDNAVARPLGINALPTVWLFDKRGVLRSINARDNYDVRIRQLLNER